MAEYTLQEYKETISELHCAITDNEQWEEVSPKSKEIAMAVHDELWHKEE